MLNRSEDTLRRHLKVEGSHFSEIKESVRRDQAVYHLECLKTPINQIAYMLGFSEPSAFNRITSYNVCYTKLLRIWYRVGTAPRRVGGQAIICWQKCSISRGSGISST